jgi:hypothetical protein
MTCLVFGFFHLDIQYVCIKPYVHVYGFTSLDSAWLALTAVACARERSQLFLKV